MRGHGGGAGEPVWLLGRAHISSTSPAGGHPMRISPERSGRLPRAGSGPQVEVEAHTGR